MLTGSGDSHPDLNVLGSSRSLGVEFKDAQMKFQILVRVLCMDDVCMVTHIINSKSIYKD